MNFDSIRQRWESFSIIQKIIISSVGVTIIALIFLLGQWATKEEYAPLMTNLETRDAGAVVSKLQELNIPYQLTSEGKTVLVPKDKVHDVRLQLASDGIFDGGGLGFELFDATKLGVTDFERRLNYQRALQEELRRTIIQLEEVEGARVHIVLPEQSVFLDSEKEATASIALKLKPLGRLKPEQVRGIVHLVASSVEGLVPEKVNIIDMNGNILNEDLFSDDKLNQAKHTLSQQEVQRNFEKEMEKRVQTMLEKVLGPNKAVAMVSAELDFDQQETTVITYGDEGVIRSEQLIEESSKNKGTGNPPVGTGSNNNPDGYPAVVPGESESERKEEIKNYEINQTQAKTIKAPGSLKRLSTAVTVDGAVNPNLVAQIESMVAAAIGYSPERGDQVVVASMNFDTTYMDKLNEDMEKAALEEAQKLRQETYIKWGIIAAAILAVIILAYVIIRIFSRYVAGNQLDQLIDEPIALKDIETEPVAEELDGSFKNYQEIKNMANNNPEQVADILKVWLAEDGGR